MRLRAAMFLILLAAAPLHARDWAQTAVDDLHFIRAVLRENHPGPVDRENPRFQEWYRKGFVRAMERGARATDFAGYFFAINYYMAGFHDGHLGALVERHLEDHLAENRLHRKWPGFAVSYDEHGFVVTAADGAGPRFPAAGDRLLSCDGRPAEIWAEKIIGDYVGLWFLPGERPLLAPLLLIDEGNPFLRMPRRCTFRGTSGTRTLALQWMPIAGAELRTRLIVPSDEKPAIRRMASGGYWISVPTFNLSDEKSAAALKTLTDEASTQRDAIRGAPIVVFDVRGNRGGSSDAGKSLLGAIWNDAYVDSMAPRSTSIDWRVSSGNIRFLRDNNLRALRRQFGDDSPQAAAYSGFVARMDAALARGDEFLREPSEAAQPLEAPPVHARPILLTDNVCASACLDFADVVLRLPGARHYGRETSADAVYIDNRALTLPSGLGFLGFSMKVHRGRPRGNNEPYRPAHVWTGDIGDTAALERWIEETSR